MKLWRFGGTPRCAYLQQSLLALCDVPLLLRACVEAVLLLVQLVHRGCQRGADTVQLSIELRLGCLCVRPALRKRMLLLCLQGDDMHLTAKLQLLPDRMSVCMDLTVAGALRGAAWMVMFLKALPFLD